MKKIKWKLILNYIIIVVVTAVILETAFLVVLREYYFGSTQTQVDNVAESIDDLYNNYMSDTDFEEKLNHFFINYIQSGNRGYEIQVVDLNGDLIFDSNGVAYDGQISGRDVYLAIETGAVSANEFESEDGESIYAVSVPLRDMGKIRAVVRLSISLEGIQSAMNIVTLLLILLGLAIVAVTVLLTNTLSKNIVNPIKELQKATEVMMDGNYDVRAEKLTEDEIGELADTFNHFVEEIEKTEKIKNDFISSISHELRTPLTSIQGWSQTLDADSDGDEIELGLNIIESETQRLIKIVEELLDFSRYQKYGIVLSREELDIGLLVRDVISQYKVKATSKDLTITNDIAGDVPFYNGDSGKLKQVIINIFENAYKFTKHGGTIHAEVKYFNGEICIRITDDGEGIDPENLPHIFDKFFKENANKAGRGLGLAISKEIIQAHGGTIDAQSTKGEGTTLEIILPVEQKTTVSQIEDVN